MKSKLISMAMLVLMLASCKENDIVFNIDEMDMRSIELSAPIFSKIHIPLYQSMEKWLDFEKISVENEIICIKYTRTKNFKWAENDNIFLNMDPWEYKVTMPALSSGTEYTFDKLPSQKIKFETETEDSYISKAELSGGKILLSAQIPDNITSCILKIDIPGMRDQNDKVFSLETEPLPPGRYDHFPEIDLEDFKVEADNNHQLAVNISFKLISSGSSAPQDVIVGIDFSIVDIEVYYMSGYFGEMKQNVKDKIAFNFFDVLDFEGDIGIRGIDLKLDAISRIGAPVYIRANEISFAYQSVPNENLIEDPFEIDVPPATEIGSHHYVTPGTKSYNKGLKDVQFVKDNFPTDILFDIDGIVNPSTVEGEIQNFVVKNNDPLSEIQITLTVPLIINVEAYNRADTIKFDYNDIISDHVDLSDGIQFITAELEVYNNMPFEVELSADALDEAGNVVDNIMYKEIIKADPYKQNIKVEFIQPQLEAFQTRDAKNIVLYTKAGTGSGKYVEVKENAALDIIVSVHVKSKIPSPSNF